MAERTVNGYKRLFEVRLLHHYWLDEGAKVFDSLPEEVRNKRLLTYDVRPFLAVAPTATTEQRLKGLRCVFKTTALGFVVAVPGDVEIPADALFEFVLTVQDADFFNYTALTLRKQEVYELYHQLEDKTYRFKENILVFSNETGTSKLLHPSGSPLVRENILFLSSAIPSFDSMTNYPVEALVGTLHQALTDLPTGTPPSPDWQTMVNPADHPVYVHQDDAPDILPPSGLTGVPKRGIALTNDLPNDLFALVRIKTLAPATPFSLLSIATPPLAASVLASPVFEIRFKNRSTAWKYFNKKTGLPDTATPILLPLTYFGNAGTQQKPSGGPVKVKDTGTLPKVTGLVSEIFI